MSAIHGETLVFHQHRGEAIELVVFGDEFYARYETTSGFSVVYDRDLGLYCYARLLDGRFVSTGAPTTKTPPPGLRRHLREDPAVRNVSFLKHYRRRRPLELELVGEASRTYGPNSGLLSGRQLSRGRIRGLAILVEFADVSTDVTQADVEALLNDPGFAEHGNFCSVRRYFELMSSGELDYTHRVVGPIRLDHRRSYYIDHLPVEEALSKAVDEHGVELSEFDSHGQGVVDALSVMYAGRTQYNGELWPHNSVLELRHGGVKTHFYTLQSLGRRSVDLSIGTFAHESGHMICRFPDLYDYGQRDGDFERSSGLGTYCLMSAGNHLGDGKVPAPVCAYLRDLAGWCPNEVSLDHAATFEVRHGDYASVHRFDTEHENEYFLVENRSRLGLDAHLPDSGLAVYHCDTRGSNEYQDGTPSNHYQCALLQADGRRDLEQAVNQGDAGDLLDDAAPELSDVSVPSTRQWDGADSGLLVSAVTAPGETMSFATGRRVSGDTVSVEARPDLLIPDADPTGISSVLDVVALGSLERIAVEVDVSHTYRGDLEVVLVSPRGTRTVLHTVKADRLDDLHLRLDSAAHEGLAALAGEELHGPWTLEVRDLEPQDSGRLDRWRLDATFHRDVATLVRESAPGIEIPDNDPAGVRDAIRVEQPGKVVEVAAHVDVSHTYRGDLQVELIAPDGTTALLHGVGYDSGDDLHLACDTTSTPALRGLVGVAIEGEWQLRVRDLMARDTGELDRWSLELEFENV